ncbi:MAG TPA: hypothetical protein DIT95_17685 [Arenibacter sp.]|nr:hypothetical protein [Arenibacter sp.]
MTTMESKNYINRDQVIDNLYSLLEIKYIYESIVVTEGFPKPLLIVILKGNCSSLTQEISSMVAKIFQEQTDYLCRIFSYEYAEQQLKEGNLFFAHNCSWEKLIVNNADTGTDVFHRYSPNEDTLNRIVLDFQQERAKLNAFMEGANFFLEKENHSQAAFNLHQYIELWFRRVELFTMGKERKCHSIKEHQTYIKPFVSELGNLFNKDVTEELSLLRLLDESYISTRYQNNYHIKIAQIQKIQEKANRIYAIISELFEDKLAECKTYMVDRPPHQEIPPVKEDASDVEIPGSEEGGTLNKIKALTKKHFYTLKRCPSIKELYSVNLITEGYLETSFMISNLLKVCITALEADYIPNRVVPEPEQNIREVLGYVLNLIPYEEMEFLDKIRQLLPDMEAQGQP